VNSGTTPVEIVAWFQVWLAYSPYGQRFAASVDVDGRTYRVEMMRIYGKLGSSEVQGVDALYITTDAILPVPVEQLADPEVLATAGRAAAAAFDEVREPIRRLARRTVEHLRLERPDMDLGLSAHRGPEQPLGREHQVDVRVGQAAHNRLPNPRLAIESLWHHEEPEDPVDVSTLPLLRPADVQRAVAAAVRDPDYSRLVLRDAHDHLREGNLRIAVIHNGLTTPDPTVADADAALAAADAYVAWLDTH
jgi:hypothetical protein